MGQYLTAVGSVRAVLAVCSDHPENPARATEHQGGKESGSGAG